MSKVVDSSSSGSGVGDSSFFQRVILRFLSYNCEKKLNYLPIDFILTILPCSRFWKLAEVSSALCCIDRWLFRSLLHNGGLQARSHKGRGNISTERSACGSHSRIRWLFWAFSPNSVQEVINVLLIFFSDNLKRSKKYGNEVERNLKTNKFDKAAWLWSCEFKSSNSLYQFRYGWLTFGQYSRELLL